MEQSSEENAKSDVVKRIHQMTKRVKSNEEVSIEYMKIYEKEKMLREMGYEEGAMQQAIENAELLFYNGADFELVRASIPLLSEEKLREIYEEVKR